MDIISFIPCKMELLTDFENPVYVYRMTFDTISKSGWRRADYLWAAIIVHYGHNTCFRRYGVSIWYVHAVHTALEFIV